MSCCTRYIYDIYLGCLLQRNRTTISFYTFLLVLLHPGTVREYILRKESGIYLFFPNSKCGRKSFNANLKSLGSGRIRQTYPGWQAVVSKGLGAKGKRQSELIIATLKSRFKTTYKGLYF